MPASSAGPSLPDHQDVLAGTDRFEALLAAGRAIASATSVTAVRQAVHDAVLGVLQAECCSSFEVQWGRAVPVTSESGWPADVVNASLIDEAITAGEVMTASYGLEGRDSFALCGPISRGKRVVAAFYATRGPQAGAFGQAEQRLAAFIAALAGATLEHVAGSEARFRALVRNSHDLTVVTDADGRTLYVSPSVMRMLGYTPAELTDLGAVEPVHPDDRDRLVRAFSLARFSPATHPTAEVRARHCNGTWRWLEVTMSNLLADISIRGLVFNIRDVTERRAAEEQLTFLALHDPLTGLANRRLLLDRLSVGLARVARSGRMVAVLYLDLDRFKDVNDSLGHDQGDQLLLQVASRLAEVVRDSDTAARLGGDEFVVVVDDLAGSGDAVAIAERIEESLNRPFDLPGHQRVSISASVGVALGDGDSDPDALLRHADAAMYQAKDHGRACHRLFGDDAVRRPFGLRPRP